jgi:protein-L-isoaspartate O-methyltransferase
VTLIVADVVPPNPPTPGVPPHPTLSPPDAPTVSTVTAMTRAGTCQAYVPGVVQVVVSAEAAETSEEATARPVSARALTETAAMSVRGVDRIVVYRPVNGVRETSVADRRRRSVAGMSSLSPRLREVVDALPLRPGLRVIEIGCGPGAAAREVARRVGPDGHVLAVDRSATAIRQLSGSAGDLIASGLLSVRNIACEDLVIEPDEARYDLAFAVRVGAFDGRHPAAGTRALERLAHAVVPGGRLFVDGGDPLRVVALDLKRT